MDLKTVLYDVHVGKHFRKQRNKCTLLYVLLDSFVVTWLCTPKRAKNTWLRAHRSRARVIRKQSGNARLEWGAVMGARLYCLLLLVVVGLSIAVADDERISFDKWLSKHGYTSDSVDYGTWKANMEYVLSHNQRHSSFSVTLNKFAHLVCLCVCVCVCVLWLYTAAGWWILKLHHTL